MTKPVCEYGLFFIHLVIILIQLFIWYTLLGNKTKRVIKK